MKEHNKSPYEKYHGAFMLITGRPGTGKTELVVNYCNTYPETTIFFSAEYSKKQLVKIIGLDERVLVFEGWNPKFNFSKNPCITAICIDYIELYEEPYLQKLIKKALKNNVRIIAIAAMRRDFSIRNPF